MAITNQQIYNGCLAGIAAAQVTTVPLATVDNSAAVAAAAAAAEANISGVVGALGGGGSTQQALLAEGLCYAAFAGRRCTDNVQADYSADVAGLGTYFQLINGQSSGIRGLTKVKSVALPAATPGPASAVVTVVDAAFTGGKTFAAYMPNPPADGTLTVATINAFPNQTECPDGAVDLLVSSIVGFHGETMNITIVVTS